MKYRIFIFAGIAGLFGGFTVAQSVVQLPEFQHTDVSTSVMVPDGGSVYTGGITRSSSGGTSSGTPILPFRNRSFGSSVGATSVQTSVQVIDIHEMDEEILNSPSSSYSHSSSYTPISPYNQRGTALQPEDRFQTRRTRNKPATAMMNTQEELKSRISPQKKAAKSGEKKKSGKLNQSLDLGKH